MIRKQLLIWVALMTGVAIGYFMRGGGDTAVEPVKAPVKTGGKAIADRGQDAVVVALRRRIAELERMLAEAPRQAEAPAEVKMAAAGRDASPHDRFREEMDRIREEDPKRYSQMTNMMSRMRKRRLARTRSRLEFLGSIDTSGMTDAQKKVHESFMETVARREELEEQMHDENLSGEDRDRLMKDMMSLDREQHRLSRQERSTLIAETAKAIGLSGEDAADVCATLGDVIDATEQSHGPGPGGMPPPGPPPGGARNGGAK